MAASNNNSSSRDSQSREYCLRWNNHQPNLVHFFGTLLNKESFVDVTLVSSEGKKILCHKMILSSCSPYFQRVFEGNPCKHPIVILKDIEFADLQTIITFIYHGEVNISQERISSILMTANSLQVKGLAEVPPGDLKKNAAATSNTSRKRDADISDSFSSQSQQQQQQHHTPLIQTPSNSWSTIDEADDNSPADIPRKKLKKSVSAAASSGISATSVSTNGDQSATGSFESGVGASVSRSGEDSNSAEGRNEVLQRSASGPPSLQVVSHLPNKSRSLDQIHDGEVIALDSELSSGGFSETQTYDEGPGGAHGTGYELDLADVKIETVSDGEIEFEDDDEEESYGHPDNFELNELNQTYPHVPSSSSLFHNPAHQFVSSSLGSKVRHGRLLIRQPRIKRPDNEAGGELYIDDSRETFPERKLEDDVDEDHLSRHDKSSSSRVIKDSEDISSGVPIVTVSQSSPTPPSSPVEIIHPDPVIPPKKSFSNIVSPINSSHSASLLMVPNLVEPVESGTTSHHQHHHHHHHHSTSTGAHLVKQISQPLLPSHTSVHQSSSGNNPVIRRQHSQPNPIQQHSSSQSRIMSLSPNSMKRTTLFQIFPADSNHSSKDDDSSPGNAILLDTTSLVHLVPSGDGTNRITITPAYTSLKDDNRRESIGGDVSPDVTLTLRDEGGSFDSSSGPETCAPVHRAGHCPALRPGPALGCNFCWNSVDEVGRILRRKTKYHCPECHINLCIVPCFQEYHEKADKKKARNKLGLPKPNSM